MSNITKGSYKAIDGTHIYVHRFYNVVSTNFGIIAVFPDGEKTEYADKLSASHKLADKRAQRLCASRNEHVTKQGFRDHPVCFVAEPNNSYPLCVGQTEFICQKCQLWAEYDDSPEGPNLNMAKLYK